MKNYENRTLAQQKKLDNEREQFKVKCSCGHTMTMVDAERMICSHCQHWVYRNKQIEFKYKMLEEIRRKNGNRNAKESV